MTEVDTRTMTHILRVDRILHSPSENCLLIESADDRQTSELKSLYHSLTVTHLFGKGRIDVRPQ